jgi:hypothetical protein
MIGDHDARLPGEALKAVDAKWDPSGTQNQACGGCCDATPVSGLKYE